MRRRALPLALAGLLGLGLASCQGPQASAPAPAPAQPALAKPQFTFASWSQVIPLIRNGQVIQTVSGRGGFSVILQDRTWVHLVAKPGDPLPKHPKDYISRNAPNAAAIRHSTE